MKAMLDRLLLALSKTNSDISFKICFWDGESKTYGKGKAAFTLTFKSKRAAKRLLQDGALGFGEEYMAGNIDVDGDFMELMHMGATPAIEDTKLSFRTKLGVLFQHLRTLNSASRSAKNISYHYDRGNDFYKLWLDESMTYSCAYFHSKEDTLEKAQQQKYEHICRKLQLKEGETLVDIGCGWGGMLIYAAKHYGVKGVGCTLSQAQVDYGQQRIKEEGFEDQVSVLYQDYRKMTGTFDKFVSIGMFEHVGKNYIPTFLTKARSLLKPGGLGLVHTIGKEKATPPDAWTLKYIFPGGYIPLLDEIIRGMGNNGLVPNDVENLRLHYAMTLEEWSKRFETNVTKIRKMYDEKFVRMWRMFLNGSAAGFRYGTTRLYQIVFTKGLNNSLPLTRQHIYS
ncbi:MAG: methyltransferase domain-containing protein [Actinobacteria bacterium]|nr:methyltransferase domain-containing protein [Actinomycetota bacterium]